MPNDEANNDADAADLRIRAAESWFGYGRWSAPFWFVGMEPGGDDDPDLYTSWEAAGGASLIDAARHEEEWNRRVPAEKHMHFFEHVPKIQRGTWAPLIHVVLGFTGSDEDSKMYQRDRLGRMDGETALIELSSIASKTLSVPSDLRSRFQQDRIEKIRNELHTNPVTFAVFYGTSYRGYYEDIVGGAFDDNGLRWSGSTLCALTTHFARPTRSYTYWLEFGRRLRSVTNAKAHIED